MRAHTQLTETQHIEQGTPRASDFPIDDDTEEDQYSPTDPPMLPSQNDFILGLTDVDSEEELLDDPAPPNQQADSPRTSAAPYTMPFPNATLPKLKIAQDMVENIQSAKLEDDIKDPELLESLNNPATESEFLDDITTLSIDIFIGLTGGSQQFYNNVRDALFRWKSEVRLLSYYVVRAKVEKTTGVTQIKTDMCPNSCIAYTGPFATLDTCPNPKCQSPRYENVKGKGHRRSSTIRSRSVQCYKPCGAHLKVLTECVTGTARQTKLRNSSNKTAVLCQFTKTFFTASSTSMPFAQARSTMTIH